MSAEVMVTVVAVVAAMAFALGAVTPGAWRFCFRR